MEVTKPRRQRARSAKAGTALSHLVPFHILLSPSMLPWISSPSELHPSKGSEGNIPTPAPSSNPLVPREKASLPKPPHLRTCSSLLSFQLVAPSQLCTVKTRLSCVCCKLTDSRKGLNDEGGHLPAPGPAVLSDVPFHSQGPVCLSPQHLCFCLFVCFLTPGSWSLSINTYSLLCL